jgi:hypothetical protein
MDPIDSIKTTDADLLAFAELFRGQEIDFIDESAKIAENDFVIDRLQIVFERSKIKFSYVLETLLPAMKLAPQHAQKIADVYYKHLNVGFGIEKADGNINYRIYFEKTDTPTMFDSSDKVLSIFGYKWDSHKPNELITTNYYLEKDSTYENIEKLITDSEYQYIPQFIQAMKDKGESFRLYSASDVQTTSKRSSFYVRLGGITLDELLVGDTYTEQDSAMFPTEALYIHLDSLYRGIPFSYFSGGIDKNGHKYHTIYFNIYRST